MGRLLNYSCVQLVGSNITNIVRNVTPLISVILGVSLLGEPLTWQLVVGVLLIVSGVTATGLNRQMFQTGQGLFTSIPKKAFLLGFSAGLSWGVSPILTKAGLNDSGSPVARVFLSYMAATLILSTFLRDHKLRATLAGMESRAARLFFLTGLLSATAQLMRYVALRMAPASVVAPLFSVSPVFALVLAFVFNRKLKVFNRAVIIGTMAIVTGTILIV